MQNFGTIALEAATTSARRDLEFDVSIGVPVEEGSLKIKATLASLAAALILYGDIRQSVDQIVEDGRAVSEYVNEQVSRDGRLRHRAPIRVMRRTLVAGRLQRLFREVERDRLSADEATRLALEAIGRSEDPEIVGVLSTPLHDEFSAAAEGLPPRYPASDLQVQLHKHLRDGRVGKSLIQQPTIALSQPEMLYLPNESIPEGPFSQTQAPGVFLHRERLSEDDVKRLLLVKRTGK